MLLLNKQILNKLSIVLSKQCSHIDYKEQSSKNTRKTQFLLHRFFFHFKQPHIRVLSQCTLYL